MNTDMASKTKTDFFIRSFIYPSLISIVPMENFLQTVFGNGEQQLYFHSSNTLVSIEEHNEEDAKQAGLGADVGARHEVLSLRQCVKDGKRTGETADALPTVLLWQGRV